MANKIDDKDLWVKPAHLQEKPKTTVRRRVIKKSDVTAETTGAAEATAARKRAPKSPTKPKKPLSKRALMLRIVKHSLIMLILIVGVAVAAHYVLTFITRHGVHCTVPQFEAMKMDDAERLAARDELNLIVNDSLYAPMYESGVILDQLPKPGVVVKPGRTIYLTVNSTQRQIVDLPYVAERSLRQAKNMLEMVGLTIEELVYVDDMAKNYVLAQLVNGKAVTESEPQRVTMGTGVTLHVGRGEDDATITPLLLGLSLREAKGALWNAGLNGNNVTFESDVDPHNKSQARVISQDTEAESISRFGQNVSIRLSSNQLLVDSTLRAYHKERELEKMRADSLMLELGELEMKLDLGE